MILQILLDIKTDGISHIKYWRRSGRCVNAGIVIAPQVKNILPISPLHTLALSKNNVFYKKHNEM